jgi:O-antigen/teichoic acid export membrane protein
LLPAIGRNGARLSAIAIMAAVQIPLLFYFVPFLGPVGAAWASVGSLVAGNVLFLLPQTLSVLYSEPETARDAVG